MNPEEMDEFDREAAYDAWVSEQQAADPAYREAQAMKAEAAYDDWVSEQQA